MPEWPQLTLANNSNKNNVSVHDVMKDEFVMRVLAQIAPAAAG